MDGQRLNFATAGITVIYGDNGSGKSGYARLIKAMVNARHRSDILPNVFQDSPNEPSGVLHYRVAGKDQTLIERFDPLEVYERDEWICGICGESVDPEALHPHAISGEPRPRPAPVEGR